MSIESITERIRTLRDTLLTGLVERDEAVRLALLASLAGEHLLLVGPPGTAKSMVARRLHLAFADATYFERLLTRFTVPEELFGPLSIKGLEEDRYERLTASYLPQASVAFLDEIFKANSAILNSLLTLLNEREFDNGAQRVKTPLIAVIGASNELPAGQELDALYDRFLLRLHVTPVSSNAFQALLAIRDTGPLSIPKEKRLSEQDRIFISTYANTLAVPEDVIALLSSLREWCCAEELDVSDRRWRKIVKLLRISAASNGRKEVSIWDCWLLQHCIWNSPEEREKVYEWYAERVGASAALDSSRITKIVVTWEARLKADQESKSQMRNEEGNLLYSNGEGAPTTDETGFFYVLKGQERLYLAPDGAYDSHVDEYVKDRSKNGKGYTQNELDRLHISTGYDGRRFAHWSKREAYLADSSNRLTREGPRRPCLEPTRHKPIYIKACDKELSEILKSIEAYQEGVAQHLRSLEHDIASHLWVTGDFAAVASTSLKHTQADVETLTLAMRNPHGLQNQCLGDLLRDSMHGAGNLADVARRGGDAGKTVLCYLYAYSGPGDVVGHELDLSSEGIGRLLDFLLETFGGGTDLDVMGEVVKRLRHEAWRKADVLLVTDGEWRAPLAVMKAVNEARDVHGSRFHGVQIGNLGRTGLHDLCDPVHVFRDWLSAGGWSR